MAKKSLGKHWTVESASLNVAANRSADSPEGGPGC